MLLSFESCKRWYFREVVMEFIFDFIVYVEDYFFIWVIYSGLLFFLGKGVLVWKDSLSFKVGFGRCEEGENIEFFYFDI